MKVTTLVVLALTTSFAFANEADTERVTSKIGRSVKLLEADVDNRALNLKSMKEVELENKYLSQENMEEYGFDRSIRDFYSALESDKSLATKNASYSVANIDLYFGALGIGAGGGKAFVETDAKNNFYKLSIDVTAGMLGINERIQNSIYLSSMKTGKALEFTMGDGSPVSLRITPAKGFNENGGKATIEFLRDGFYSKEAVLLARSTGNKKFYLWQNNKPVSSISVTMRGMSIPKMYVGKYKINTSN